MRIKGLRLSPLKLKNKLMLSEDEIIAKAIQELLKSDKQQREDKQ